MRVAVLVTPGGVEQALQLALIIGNSRRIVNMPLPGLCRLPRLGLDGSGKLDYPSIIPLNITEFHS